jgi:hypothetical protein
MSAPTLDTPPGSRPGSSAGHRRPRARLVLVASALLVLAVALGASLAIATQPVDHQTPAATGAVSGSAAPGQTADPAQQQAATAQGGTAQTPARSQATSAPAADSTPALDDGDHDAYITKVDAAGHRIVVDVVQVFHDGKAVQAAIADGETPAEAKYLTTWVRNQNPRLRTLPLASDVSVRLRDACGEPGNDRQALLAKLAANARQNGTYYYTLTVSDGQVRRIQERLAINAC